MYVRSIWHALLNIIAIGLVGKYAINYNELNRTCTPLDHDLAINKHMKNYDNPQLANDLEKNLPKPMIPKQLSHSSTQKSTFEECYKNPQQKHLGKTKGRRKRIKSYTISFRDFPSTENEEI